MPETIQSAISATVDAKQTAANIAKGVQDKANGKAPAAPDPKANGQQKAPESTQPADPNAGKEKYVVDGKDVWLTPEQARAYVQKGIAFEPRVDELNRLKNEAQRFLQTLKTDPARILFNPQIGLTAEAVFEKIMTSDRINDATKETVGKWYWENVVEPTKLSPQELEARENKKKLSDYEQRDKHQKDEEIRRDNKRRADLAGQQAIEFVREAMKDSGLPDINTPLGNVMAKRTLEISHMAAKSGRSITPKEAIAQVRKDLKEFGSLWLDSLDEENLVKELGEKNAEKVKKYFLKLVKQTDKEPTISKGNGSSSNGKKKINLDEFHDYLDKLKREGK